MQRNDNNFYEVLGVSRDVDADKLKKAYHKKAIETHPDKNPGKDTQQLFIKVTLAYQILSNDDERAAYDASLNETVNSEVHQDDQAKVNPFRKFQSTSLHQDLFPRRKNRNDEKDFTLFYKFIFIGSAMSKKSDLLHTMVHGEFMMNFKTKIGLRSDVHTKYINDPVLGRVKLSLWDTSGQERFDYITQTHVNGATAMVFVIGNHNQESWQKSLVQLMRLKSSGQLADREISLIIIKDSQETNHHDFTCDPEQILELCKRYNITTKCYVDLNDNYAFRILDKHLLELVNTIFRKENNSIKLAEIHPELLEAHDDVEDENHNTGCRIT